jgi:hypothetical protein
MQEEQTKSKRQLHIDPESKDGVFFSFFFFKKNGTTFVLRPQKHESKRIRMNKKKRRNTKVEEK